MALRCGDLLKLLADEDSPVFVFSNQMACKYGTTKNVSGLVVECWPAALKAEVQTPGGEPKIFNIVFHQQKLSSLSIACAVKLEGALYSVFYAEAS